ncbi:bifunctional diguanylate cyclase/phosphodiesterase [Thiomicrospira sp. ALE5]|uniref:putative bifunctional diguanylate cyclase/phosphodiesterase n=1 Tax=Thiomicrospira sp. ALE5 TaxID=748650 RepID=UPI0008EB7357|nr:EAL domain-containing protein [Thiomicrospira sp. ALE5]SFR58893.1 PAS domain S-box-containing protein/diguanylate cyclase (GGDEF) domain-containing protein [Thiomicrospira sp. ALE5]
MNAQDYSHLEQDILAYREENSRLNEERQSLEHIAAFFEQRISELEAELELQTRQEMDNEDGRAFYQTLYMESPLALVLIDHHGEILLVNTKARSLLANKDSQFEGRNFRKFLSKPSRILFIKLLKNLSLSEKNVTADTIFTHQDGQDFTLRAQKIVLGDVKSPRFLMSLTEVSLTQLSDSSIRLASSIIDQIREGLMITDHRGKIIKVNHAFTEITGFSQLDALGATPAILHSGRHPQEFYQDMWTEIHHHGWWAGEIWNKRKTGEVFPEWLQISRIKDDVTDKVFYAATFSDITDRKYHQNQLDRLAFYDSLTGLPNRTLLNQTLDARLSRLKNEHPYQIAVMFLDLDKFKDVNDHYGHAEGDKVLREATQRIVSRIRENDMTARIGGDEFVLVLTRIQSKQDAEHVTEDLLAILSEPYVTQKGKHFLSASIGIAFSPKDGNNVEDLMRRADAAMYVAKNKGRNTFHVFEPKQEDQLIESNVMLSQIRLAVAQPLKHIQMHYQPIFSADQPDKPIHYEALIRLIDTHGNLVYPNLFIELAEQHGLIGQLGMALFEKVCEDIAGSTLDETIKIAVNLSPLQFYIEHLAFQLSSIAEKSGLSLSRFYFEITETATMQNLSLMISVLSELRSQGAQIMLDDFGTGYASLSMLKNIPVNVLKIDQSFVFELAESPQTQSLVRAMIGMAQALDLKTVAEGVETQQQAEWLERYGADYLQGYLLGRPQAEFLSNGTV